MTQLLLRHEHMEISNEWLVTNAAALPKSWAVSADGHLYKTVLMDPSFLVTT
jgi:hypothetical protein